MQAAERLRAAMAHDPMMLSDSTIALPPASGHLDRRFGQHDSGALIHAADEAL